VSLHATASLTRLRRFTPDVTRSRVCVLNVTSFGESFFAVSFRAYIVR
jgi:hypothetical protein